MKKKISLLLVSMMIFLSISINVSATEVTALTSGYTSVQFSNEYIGYCIDKSLHGAVVNDVYTVDDTTVATNNNSNVDISNYLKVLFTQHFNQIFESDDFGGYIIKPSIADGDLPRAIWGLSDDVYTYQLSKELVEAVKAYSGPEIPDHGYKLTLENGDVITFDFIVLTPSDTNTMQSFFCFKIQVAHEEPVTLYNVTVSSEGNGTATADLTSGPQGTEVTLTALADEGYEFKGWEVLSGNVLIEDNKFTIGTEDVEIKANFEEIVVVPETYQVTITTEGYGTATADPTSGVEGTEVTIIATAEEGYEFKGWEVLSGNITIEDNKFTIGTEDVEIKAIFGKILEITKQPADLKVPEGLDARIKVEAKGDFLTYQWFINRNDGKGWIKLVGATKETFVEENVESNYSGFQYKCEIKDVYGESVETDIAVLFVSAETKAPETGDEMNSLIWVMTSMVSGSSIILMKKKRD